MKPILEIKSSDTLKQQQHQQMQDYLSALFPEYNVVIMDGNMSLRIHDDEMLSVLRGIRSSLQGILTRLNKQDCQP